MTTLIASVSSGKGTWTQVVKLINGQEWDNIIIVTNQFGSEKFSAEKEFEKIIIEPFGKPISELVEAIKSQLQGKIKGTEVALNLVSGTGKEHMAIISAIMKLGFGFRLVAMTQQGFKEV